MIFLNDTLAKLTFNFVYFVRFFGGALSSGALSYRDISGNIRVKYRCENVTSRQFLIEICIFSSLNYVGFVSNDAKCIKIAVVRTVRFFMRFSAPREVMISSLGSLESPLKTACECGAGALWRVRLAENKRENFAEKSIILLKIWKKYKSSRFLKESDHPKHITGCIGI